MKVAGFGKDDGGQSSVKLEVPHWYLIKATKCTLKDAATKPRLETVFIVSKGRLAGARFVEHFYLSESAITRLNCFCSRATYTDGSKYPEELMASGDVEEEKIVGLTCYAFIVADPKPGETEIYPRIDGWKMKPPTEPPDEETGQAARDYTKQDEEASALDGL